MLNKDIKKENIEVKENYYYVDEFLEIRQLVKKNISFKEYFRAFKLSKSYFVLNTRDLRPIIYKFFYAIGNRLFK